MVRLVAVSLGIIAATGLLASIISNRQPCVPGLVRGVEVIFQEMWWNNGVYEGATGPSQKVIAVVEGVDGIRRYYQLPWKNPGAPIEVGYNQWWNCAPKPTQVFN